jgi:hypothetical protein
MVAAMSDQRAFAAPALERAPEPPVRERAPEALAARALRLQRTAGNRVARRVLARLVTTTTDWTTVVPDADPGTLAISKLKGGKQVIEYGKAPKPKVKKGSKPPPDPVPIVVDPSQQPAIDAACQAVDAYRATLPQPAATGGNVSSQGAKWAGTWWTRYTATRALAPPKATKKKPHPDDTRTDAQKAAYESASTYDAWLTGVSKATTTAAIEDRLFLDIAGLEGGTDSINVYDKQIVTWGGGLGGASGAVPTAMKLVADSKAAGGGKVVGEEVTRVLHDAGISFGTGKGGGTEFVVLDTGSKRKFHGDSALQLIKADNRLLMLFTSIARGELPGVATDPGLQDAMRKAVFDAQKDFFLHRYNGGDYAAAIKQLGPTWPYDSIMMVLHLEWWGVSRWTQFKDTGGDMKKIIRKAFELYSHYVETRHGANVAKKDLAAHLQNFGGASSAACWGPLIQIRTEDLEADAYYAEIKPAVAAGAKTTAQDATYRKLKD